MFASSAWAVQMLDVAFSRRMCCSRVCSAMRYAVSPCTSIDTPRFEVPGGVQAVGQILKAAQSAGINLGYRMDNTIHVALDETVDETDILALLVVFGAGSTKAFIYFQF